MARSLEGKVAIVTGSGQGVINIPVGDSVRLSFGIDYQERDGYLENRTGIGPDDMADVDTLPSVPAW